MAAGKHRNITRDEQSEYSRNVAGRGFIPANDNLASRRASSTGNVSRDQISSHYSDELRKRSRGTALKCFAAFLAAALIIFGIMAWNYVQSVDSRLSAGVDKNLLSALSERKTPSEPFYMLLLGVDKGEERVEEDGDEYWNYRADTIILARVDPRDLKVTLVSIPRDTYVSMDENGNDKINAAYSIGGPSYMVKVVQEFAGVPISHYAEIDFDAFSAIVDQIGGIDVTLPVPISDPEYTGLELSAGEHHLNGHDALMLCRSRHAYDEYGGGDFYRAANQRMVISVIARKVLASDAFTMTKTVSTLADYVTTDLSVSEIVDLGSQMKSMDIDKDFYSGQEPTISTYYDDIWYEVCDTEAWKAMMERVDNGLPPYENADQDFTAGYAGAISSDGQGHYADDAGGNGKGTDVVAKRGNKDFSGTVSVLNGAGTEGLAAQYAEKLNERNFTASAANAADSSETTFVVYNGDDAQGKANAVAEVVGGNPKIIENDGTYPTDANVVLVLGSDKAPADSESDDSSSYDSSSYDDGYSSYDSSSDY